MDSRDRFLLTLVAIAACVFLFACGWGGQDADQTAAAPPPKPGHKIQVLANVPPPAPPAAPGTPAPAEASVAGPAGQSAFGTDEMTEVEDDGPSGSSARAEAPPRASAGRVFSNKDLERYRRTKEEFGFRDGVVVVDVTKKPEQKEDAVSTGMTEAQRAAELAELRAKMSAVMQELDYQKKRVLPLENPFVAKPKISEDDKLAESGMGNNERLQRVKERIAQLEGELGSLQGRYAALQNVKPSDADDSRDATPDRE